MDAGTGLFLSAPLGGVDYKHVVSPGPLNCNSCKFAELRVQSARESRYVIGFGKHWMTQIGLRRRALKVPARALRGRWEGAIFFDGYSTI